MVISHALKAATSSSPSAAKTSIVSLPFSTVGSVPSALSVIPASVAFCQACPASTTASETSFPTMVPPRGKPHRRIAQLAYRPRGSLQEMPFPAFPFVSSNSAEMLCDHLQGHGALAWLASDEAGSQVRDVFGRGLSVNTLKTRRLRSPFGFSVNTTELSRVADSPVPNTSDHLIHGEGKRFRRGRCSILETRNPVQSKFEAHPRSAVLSPSQCRNKFTIRQSHKCFVSDACLVCRTTPRMTARWYPRQSAKKFFSTKRTRCHI